MKKSLLKVKSDIVFKRIFGDSRNKDILSDFLKSVLNIPYEDYEDITIVDPHTISEYENDKLSILDVKLKTKSKRIIDIEIQILKVPALSERILYYTSKMITEQINVAENYHKIQKVISIIILDYTMIKEDDEYHHLFKLFDKKNNLEFSDKVEINILELPKLPQNTDDT